MAYSLPKNPLQQIIETKKGALPLIPTKKNVLAGSPVSNVKPQTLLTLKQPLSDQAVSNLSKIQGTSNAAVGNPAIPKTAPTQEDTRPPMTKAEKIRRANIMVDAGATQEEIQAYVSQFKTSDVEVSPTPVQPQGTFADQRPTEGVIEQTAMAAPRGVGDYLSGVKENAYKLLTGAIDLTGKALTDANDYLADLGVPGYTKTELTYAPAQKALEKGYLPTALSTAKGYTGLLTDVLPATAATKVGFNIAAETPGLRVVPQAVGGAMNIASKGLESTGLSPETSQDIVGLAGDALFLKGGMKGNVKIMDVYKNKGLTPSILETAKVVPQTIFETAKQPVDLAIGTAKLGGKVIKGTGNVIDWGVGKAAQGLLTNKKGTQELFQATSPSYNKFGKSIGIDKLKEKAALADDAVVRAGYKPKNTAERVDAYKSTMNDIWKDIETARGGVKENFSGREIGDLIRAKIEQSKVNKKLSPSQLKDVAELQRWAEYYDSLGKLDMPKLAEIRTQINGETTWNKKLDNGDLFNKTFQDLAAVIRKTENNVIYSAKGTNLQGLMDRYGALSTLLEDVVKQDIKAQRAKGEGLTTTYSRIEGVGDIVQGLAKTVTGQRGIGEVLKGGAKIVIGKTLAKLKDTDFLIENGYNKLAKSLGVEKGPSKIPTKRVFPETKGLSPILESLGKSKSPSKSKGGSKLPKKSVPK